MYEIFKNTFFDRTPQVDSSIGVEFFRNFFADLRMSLGVLECFDLLSSVYNPKVVCFCIFCLSSTLKKVLEHFLPSSTYLMLAKSLAPFAFLFSN